MYIKIQQTCSFSTSTIETLEKDVKYVQSWRQNDVNNVVLMSFLSTLNIFHTSFGVSLVDFEQVNVYLWMIRLIHELRLFRYIYLGQLLKINL